MQLPATYRRILKIYRSDKMKDRVPIREYETKPRALEVNDSTCSVAGKTREEYVPAGFRWITNYDYILENREVSEEAIAFIQQCRETYGDVAIIPALMGDKFLKASHDDIGICVKKVQPVERGFSQECSCCGKRFRSEDLVQVRTCRGEEMGSKTTELECMNCFNVYSYSRKADGVYVRKYYY